MTPNSQLDDKTLERVRALLAKAESTSFPEEAEAFSVKAQELMARYGIDAAMIASAAATSLSPSQRIIRLDNPYVSAKALLVSVIAQANRCSAVWEKHHGQALIFGFDVDLDVVELLYVSLHLQATRAMVADGGRVDRAGRSRTRSFRHAFLLSYASRIGERLHAATDAAVAEAEATVGAALVPVLAERIEAVEAAMAEAVPQTKKASFNASNADGYLAGRAAADRADLHNRDAVGRTRSR